MATIDIAGGGPLDADRPTEILLRAFEPPTSTTLRHVQEASDLFARFAREGAFGEVRDGVSASVSLQGGAVRVNLTDLPADPATLGVLCRMLLATTDQWTAIAAEGTTARHSSRALTPIQPSLSLVPRLRDPLRVPCEINTSAGWYCVELTRHAGWRPTDLAVLERCMDLWMAVCRAGGLSDVTSPLTIPRGDVGMDSPQVGEDFWSAQIGANEIHLAAISSLVNMLDHASATRLSLDAICVT